MPELTGVYYAIGLVFPFFKFRSRAQLVPRLLQGIFTGTMLYRALALLALNIDTTWCVIIWLTSALDPGSQLVKRLTLGFVEGVSNPYAQLIYCFILRKEGRTFVSI